MQQKSINLVHRRFKFPEIEGSNKSNRSKGSPTSSRNNTSQERDLSIDGGNSIQVFKIRNLQVSERSETPKQDKIFSMSKSTRLRSRQEQNEDYTEHNQQELILPKIYSPVITPSKTVVSKMKGSIFKPLLNRQESIDHLINIKLQPKIHDQLKKGVNIKCLYLSQRTDVQINKIIVLNFDSVLLRKRKSFWEQQNEITMCSQIIGSRCDNSYCACVLSKELKSTLYTLSKQFYIVFLFECAIRGQVWQQYLIESGFPIDAIYSIQQIRLTGGGIKMKQIISNFGSSDIKLLLYFGTIDCESQQLNIPQEQFYYQIPIVQAKISLQIYLFQLLKSKSLDSKLLFEICMLNCSRSENFNFKRHISVDNYDLGPIIKKMIQLEEEDFIENHIFKSLKQDEEDKVQILDEEEQEEDVDQKNALLIWLYQSKKLLLDYFKSLNNEDQTQNPISMIGDVLRRNSSIQQNYMLEDYEKQANRYKLYKELQAQTKAQNICRKQIQIDCLIIHD
ncbi:unnamed protein product (macronuclear) [Paramecium tetraurelia]|uniref:Uncharacterized protein n=1 Tax=Paramecium tetraurelia TaxID=5888 RepID=A0DI37_PARTE|nr:uncharacterized protein GSPATT00017075001 [Paramecium tetraurelia]CAK82704.1 unnamed protein product [Paramecium tetraurelia]|eukprot:XP_001450101.1 hypothetical protein (macronuclear) [Paramecium tetraurelia strain d4-2]